MKLKITATVVAVLVLVLIFAIAFSKDNEHTEISDSQLNSSLDNVSDSPSYDETVSSETSYDVSIENSVTLDGSEDSGTDNIPQENSEISALPPPVTSDTESRQEEDVVSVPEEDSGDEFSKEDSDDESDFTENSEVIEPDVSVPENSETSEPEVSLPETSDSEASDSEASEPVTLLTFEEYLALSSAEQQAYFESFPSIQEYIAWYNAAQKEYEDSQNKVEVSGDVNIGDFVNGSK